MYTSKTTATTIQQQQIIEQQKQPSLGKVAPACRYLLRRIEIKKVSSRAKWN